MTKNYTFIPLIMTSFLFIGCSGKSFTMQSYADEWFNDKHPESKEEVILDKEQEEAISTVEPDQKTKHTPSDSTTLQEDKESPVTQTKQETPSTATAKQTNAAIKTGPGSNIAWSSTYKQDEKMKGKGAMQDSLDTWTEEEWEPKFEDDTNQTEADKKANQNFTLQHYVDKIGKYMDEKDAEEAGKPKEPAHYEKINNLPVIGK